MLILSSRAILGWFKMNEPLYIKAGFTSYAVGVPCDNLRSCDFQTLLRIIAQNAPVLKQALGAEELPVVWLKGRLWFPWFPLRGVLGETQIYTDLIFRLCDMAQLWYIPAENRHVRRGRFGMWLLLRDLGLWEPKQRKVRKFLLKNF